LSVGEGSLGPGVKLFNRGSFFQAHEAWEAVWLKEEGAEKLFVQGLIQCAAAIVHAERGNIDGCTAMFAKAREKLIDAPKIHRGIDVAMLLKSMDRFVAVIGATRDKSRLPPRPKIRVTEQA
jgi:hypothetical protein